MNSDYKIKRSAKRKKLTITVERDRSVVVHAPVHISEEQIAEVLAKKRQWIYEKTRHKQKYTEQHPPGKEVVNGESALYLGRNYRIQVEQNGLTEVKFENGFYVPADQIGNRREVLRDWYVERAAQKILPRVLQASLQMGVDFKNARIVDNRYRWGSCTVKDNIHLNWRLIKAPWFVIDYVIIHELAHLIEANHTPSFWNIVKSQTPTMEKAKDWLKENGQILEQEV